MINNELKGKPYF